MIAPRPALAHVVQQPGHVEHRRPRQLRAHPGHLALLLGEGPVAQALEVLEDHQRVHVDRVDVVERVLPPRGHPGELGDQPGEHPEVVHGVDHRAVRLRVLQQGEQIAHHRRIAPLGAGDQVRVLRDQVLGVAVDLEVLLLGDPEDPHQGGRVLQELGPVGDGELALPLLEAAGGGDRLHRAAPPVRGPALDHEARVQRKLSCMEVVGAHEALHPVGASIGVGLGRVHVAQERRDLLLVLEAQVILPTAGEEVELGPHPEEEPIGPLQRPALPGREHAEAHHLPDPVGPPPGPGHPQRGVELPEPALALLHVGLEQEHRVAEARAPGLRLTQLGLDQRPHLGPAQQVRLEPAREGLELRRGRGRGPRLHRRPRHQAGVEERGEHRGVLLGHLGGVLDRPHRLADLEAEVPQAVEHPLHPRPGRRGLARVERRALGHEEEQVHVRPRAELLAPVAAEGHDLHPGRRLRRLGAHPVPHRVQGGLGQAADHRVHLGGDGQDHLLAPVRRQPPGGGPQLGPHGLEPGLQAREALRIDGRQHERILSAASWDCYLAGPWPRPNARPRRRNPRSQSAS